MVLDLVQFRNRKLATAAEGASLPVDRNSWRRDQQHYDSLAELSVQMGQDIRAAFENKRPAADSNLGQSKPALEEINPNLLRALRRGAGSKSEILQTQDLQVQMPEDLKPASSRAKLRLVPSDKNPKS